MAYPNTRMSPLHRQPGSQQEPEYVDYQEISDEQAATFANQQHDGQATSNLKDLYTQAKMTIEEQYRSIEASISKSLEEVRSQLDRYVPAAEAPQELAPDPYSLENPDRFSQHEGSIQEAIRLMEQNLSKTEEITGDAMENYRE